MSRMTKDEFIATLFATLGYDTTAQRKGWMQKMFAKNYADELTEQEKHIAIDSLIADRDERKGKR